MRGRWENATFVEIEEIKGEKEFEYKYSEDEREKAIYKIYYDDERYCTYPDGTKYRGGLDNGIPHGEGRIIYTDGSIYEG